MTTFTAQNILTHRCRIIKGAAFTQGVACRMAPRQIIKARLAHWKLSGVELCVAERTINWQARRGYCFYIDHAGVIVLYLSAFSTVLVPAIIDKPAQRNDYPGKCAIQMRLIHYVGLNHAFRHFVRFAEPAGA